MKYRIEVQQVFAAHGYDRGGEWLELGDKPRGKAAAIALMETIQADSGFKPPYRVVSVDALGDRVEVARIESPHKPAPKYAVEVSDAQGEKRQEFDSLPLAMQLYTACVDGAENDPRQGYTRRVALVGIESGETHYKWEYKPQALAKKQEATRQEVRQAFQAIGYSVSFKRNPHKDTLCNIAFKNAAMLSPLVVASANCYGLETYAAHRPAFELAATYVGAFLTDTEQKIV